MTPFPPASREVLDSLVRDATGPVYNVSAVGVTPHPDGQPVFCLRLGTEPGNAPVYYALSPDAALRLARDLRAAVWQCLGEEEETVLPHGAKKDRKAR